MHFLNDLINSLVTIFLEILANSDDIKALKRVAINVLTTVISTKRKEVQSY